ncbi:MAG: ABC transporter permease [Gammaproteobacteria bacterium]|nr:ABC transporter permease [Gammaproteobacteria bacterium]
MSIKVQTIALYTIVRHQLSRMFRIKVQTFLPAAITTLLYFAIFGTIVGKRVGMVEGFTYNTFIAPGLLMIVVINNAYTNPSSALFTARFQRSIEELLVSPIHDSLILLGYILGGILRGLLVGILVLIVSAFYIDLHIQQILLSLCIVALIACLFSLAGFTNGMLSKTFEDNMIIPTFILTPLTYLGGVFYSISMLPPTWHRFALLNPIFYMVDLLRYAMIGYPSQHIGVAILVISIFIIGLFGLNLMLIKRNVGIRD